MLKLKNGPVEGSYACKRAPSYLRAVVDARGTRDVLDLPNDEPRPDERVYIYRRIGEAGQVHLNMGRSGGTGFYALAEYEWIPGTDGEAVRRIEDWRAWCVIETNTQREEPVGGKPE